MKSRAPSILGADLVLHGSLTCEGEIQLDGTVEGDVRAGSLTIGEEASINGEVIAETIVVRGRVQGSVRARQVQLASTARIEGDIIHSSLSVESGAFFDGNCRHASDPMSDRPSGPANDARRAQTMSTSGGMGSPTPKPAQTPPPPSASTPSAAGGAPSSVGAKTS